MKTLKEMTDRIDKVSLMNTSLWQKTNHMKKVDGVRPISRGNNKMKKKKSRK